jgi:hypothetical protein
MISSVLTFHHLLLQFGDLKRQLLQRRLVVVDNRIQQGVGDAVGGAGDVDGPFAAAFLDHLHAFHGPVVVGHQEVLPEEEVKLGGREHAVLAAVVDRMDHHEEVRGEPIFFLGEILLDLGRRGFGDAVLDGEWVEVEDIAENHLAPPRGGGFDIDPEEEVGVGQEGGHQERGDVLSVKPSFGGERERPDHAMGTARMPGACQCGAMVAGRPRVMASGNTRKDGPLT